MNGPLEADEFRTGTFARRGPLSLEDFPNSGADWLNRFRKYASYNPARTAWQPAHAGGPLVVLSLSGVICVGLQGGADAQALEGQVQGDAGRGGEAAQGARGREPAPQARDRRDRQRSRQRWEESGDGAGFWMMLLVAVVVIVPTLHICSKAGYSGWLSLLVPVPIANLLLLYFLAFAEWPLERRVSGLGPPPAAPPA